MPHLFNTFSELKKYCGGGINTSLDMRSIEPVISDAAQYHLVPYLGDLFLADLVSAYNTDSTSGAQDDLLPYVQNTLAKLTIYEYSKIGGIELGEAGFHRIENDNRKSAFKYQENQFREYFLEKGYNDLETLMAFLTKNATAYPDWANSEASAFHRSGLLIYANTFRMALNVQCDRYSFECLRPLIRQAEVWMIKKCMPSAFYTQIKSAYLESTMDAHQKELVSRIQYAIASRAMAEATKMQWIQYKAGRIIVTEEFGDAGTANRTLPNQIDNARYWQHEMWAQTYNQDWKEYITPTLFPLAYDVASGGTNTASDAWHIATEAEQTSIDQAKAEAIKRPVFQF